MEIIDLNRQFHEGGPSRDPDVQDRLRRADWPEKNLLSWSEVLSHRFVVVLGEAGSGKTEEFLLRKRLCELDGATAFYVHVEHLADSGSLIDSIESPDLDSFEQWLRAEDEAVFFLDSVDEALLNHKRFDLALRRFARGVGKNILQLRLLISCRVTDWKPNADGRLVEREILSSFTQHSRKATGAQEDGQAKSPAPTDISSHARSSVKSGVTSLDAPEHYPNLLVVSLAPLDLIQSRTLAQADGAKPIDDFMSAIHVNSAEPFAERPQDVLWLTSYWNRHGNLGSLRELIEENTRQKLKETNPSYQSRGVHSPKQLREGAEGLAAAASFCKASTFKILGDTGVGTVSTATGDALDATDVLSDWSDRDVHALLSRAIFDEATYGRTRFHHRSIREYLTACSSAPVGPGEVVPVGPTPGRGA